MLAFTVSDCEADLSAGSLEKVPAGHRVYMMPALEFLRELDHAIGGGGRVIVVALQELEQAAGMSAPEYRVWRSQRITMINFRRARINGDIHAAERLAWLLSGCRRASRQFVDPAPHPPVMRALPIHPLAANTLLELIAPPCNARRNPAMNVVFGSRT
jgi:hypothetical protein